MRIKINVNERFTEEEFINMKKGEKINCPFCGRKLLRYKGKADITQEDLFSCLNCGFEGVNKNGPSVDHLLGNKTKKEIALKQKSFLEADIEELELELSILWKNPEEISQRNHKKNSLARLKNNLTKFKNL